MVKRAKLTLEPDPVENDLTQPADVPPPAPAEKAKTAAAIPEAPAKRSGIFKTVLFIGLTIASIVILNDYTGFP